MYYTVALYLLTFVSFVRRQHMYGSGFVRMKLVRYLRSYLYYISGVFRETAFQMELRCEVNSGNETLYGGFNSRIDGWFNQAD
jgi:hypothetical protein